MKLRQRTIQVVVDSNALMVSRKRVVSCDAFDTSDYTTNSDHAVTVYRTNCSETTKRPVSGEHDPLLHVPMRKVEIDIRHNRRALTDEEFLKLVTTTERSDKSVEGMTGFERSFLYTLARMTALRRSELGSLTAASFMLGRDSFVIVEAGYSNHRERDM